jgi:PKD repeat protein
MKTFIKTTIFFSLVFLLFICSSNLRAQSCVGFSVSLGANGLVFGAATNPTAGATYTWNFGGTTISNTASAAYFFPSNGTYTIQLSASGGTPACNTSSLTVVTITNVPCAILYTTSPASSPSVCNGSATVNAVSMCGSVSYTWFPFNLVGSTFTTLCSQTYTVFAAASSTGANCCLTASVVLTVSANPCALTASFATLQSTVTGGLVNFTNLTTPQPSLNPNTYTMNFGDSSPPSNTFTSSHTYSANGTYSVTLSANSTSGCFSTITKTIVVNSVCNLVASFTATYSPNGLVSFYNTTSVTTSFSTYTWTLGDGSSNIINTGSSVTHTYTNGTYTVILTAKNNTTLPACISTASTVITVTSNICLLNAALTHTLGSSGLVNFTSASAGTNSNTGYLWNFGDGYTSINQNPSHTYQNGGTHYVKLVTTNSTTCTDSIVQALNVTGISCTANSNFTLTPTGTPNYWVAFPAYPWNVINAVWNWGDNSSSNTLYSSHQYSTAGNYNICLSVTVSCNVSSSTCVTYSVYRTSSAIIYVSVANPSAILETGINVNEENVTKFTVSPNPNEGLFTLHVEGLLTGTEKISIYNVIGEKIMEKGCEATNMRQDIQLDISDEAAGIYFVAFGKGNKAITKKIVLTK